MTSLSIQFHALVEEVAGFVWRWLTLVRAHAIAVEYQPFSARAFDARQVESVVSSPLVRRIVFTESPPECNAAGNGALLEANPGALVLNIGRMTPRGLEECHLSAMRGSRAWLKVAADLKKATKAGAIITHEATGLESADRAHRFTPGASHLAVGGVSLRQFAQSPARFRPIS